MVRARSARKHLRRKNTSTLAKMNTIIEVRAQKVIRYLPSHYLDDIHLLVCSCVSVFKLCMSISLIVQMFHDFFGSVHHVG